MRVARALSLAGVGTHAAGLAVGLRGRLGLISGLSTGNRQHSVACGPRVSVDTTTCPPIRSCRRRPAPTSCRPFHCFHRSAVHSVGTGLRRHDRVFGQQTLVRRMRCRALRHDEPTDLPGTSEVPWGPALGAISSLSSNHTRSGSAGRPVGAPSNAWTDGVSRSQCARVQSEAHCPEPADLALPGRQAGAPWGLSPDLNSPVDCSCLAKS